VTTVSAITRVAVAVTPAVTTVSAIARVAVLARVGGLVPMRVVVMAVVVAVSVVVAVVPTVPGGLVAILVVAVLLPLLVPFLVVVAVVSGVFGPGRWLEGGLRRRLGGRGRIGWSRSRADRRSGCSARRRLLGPGGTGDRLPPGGRGRPDSDDRGRRP
jgi:hypothetical protein